MVDIPKSEWDGELRLIQVCLNHLLGDGYACIYCIIFSIVLYVRNISQYISQRSKERGSSLVTIKEHWQVDEHPF